MAIQLSEIAPEVFAHERELALGVGFRLNARTTIIRRGDDLWVHSPLPDDGWYAAAAELGRVRWLVAPSCLHHLYIGDAARHFRDARVAGPARLRDKRPDLAIDLELDGGELSGAWPADIRVVPVAGAGRVAEHLFYDAASRSLLVTDLVFNNDRGANRITRVILALFAPSGRPSRSREWRFLIRDKRAFADSLAILSELDLDRVIPAHGRVIDDTARAVAVMRTGKAAPPALPR